VGARSVRNSRIPLRGPESVKDLLGRISQNRASPVAERRQAQVDWREWLKNRLPEGLESRVTAIVERDQTLTVFAESAAWSARLRFAIAELEGEIHERNADIGKLLVKVMPRQK
jgi:predicted nucleic acid-binding Zn ribbon protein